MNRLTILLLFVLSLLSPSANAQLDKQYQEQERSKNVKKAKCERFYDLAQYKPPRDTSLSLYLPRHYIDQNQQVFAARNYITCGIVDLGTLNVETFRLLKIEGDLLVEYSDTVGSGHVRRSVLGKKRQ